MWVALIRAITHVYMINKKDEPKVDKRIPILFMIFIKYFNRSGSWIGFVASWIVNAWIVGSWIVNAWIWGRFLVAP